MFERESVLLARLDVVVVDDDDDDHGVCVCVCVCARMQSFQRCPSRYVSCFCIVT